MAKKITITLDDNAEQYFNDVAYSLDLPHEDGYKLANQGQVISHCLNELKAFEEITGQSITDYLANQYTDRYNNYLNI